MLAENSLTVPGITDCAARTVPGSRLGALGLLIGMLLLPAAGIQAQETGDTADGQEESSLLEQVYEHRISLLQDSLFLTHEQLDAVNYVVRQLEQREASLADSLAEAQAQLRPLADSLSRLFILYDRAVTENQQNRARLGALSDSLVEGFQREQSLKALNDSLMVFLARTQAHLATTTGARRSYSDTLVTLRTILEKLQRELDAREQRVTGMYEQLKYALSSSGGTAVDSATDQRRIAYLQQLMDYRLESTGIARLFQSRSGEDQIYGFKLEEFRRYLDQVDLRGHTPQALNLLAQAYVEQEDFLRGTLAYLKTTFLFPESEAGLQAMDRLEELVERDGELGRLYFEVVLNPDSLNVSDEDFHRHYNYLDRIRRLSHATAKTWFIREAQQFLSTYPGVLQADEVLVWIAYAYHELEQYHNEVLTYLKIRTFYPLSRYRPGITYTMAQVVSDDIKDYNAGITRYAGFREEFPDHEKAPAALFAQAAITENELHDYQQAADLYRELTDTYPQDALAPVSLFQYARLLRERLASPTGALAVYDEILNKYGDQPESGIPALEGLATIARETRQYDAAVVYFLDVHERFPGEQERAVAAILEAADIYESQLKNLDATIHTLHIILDNYPEYPDIKSIQRRVQKLQKKRG